MRKKDPINKTCSLSERSMKGGRSRTGNGSSNEKPDGMQKRAQNWKGEPDRPTDFKFERTTKS